jgi:hypothetical protein
MLQHHLMTIVAKNSVKSSHHNIHHKFGASLSLQHHRMPIATKIGVEKAHGNI